MRDVQTQAEMIAVINAGGVVTYKGRIIRRVEDVPDDAQILLDYPMYAYTSINGNAKGILGYEIYGTPSNGDTLVFDGTDLRWEFGAGGGGGGAGTVNTGTAKRLAFYPSTGTTVDDTAGLEFDPAADKNLSLTPAATKSGLMVKEGTSVSAPADIAGSPALLHLHSTDHNTYYQLSYTTDNGSTVANYTDGDGNLSFDHFGGAEEAENDLLSYGGLAFYSSTNGGSNYGGIYHSGTDTFSLGLVTDFNTFGNNTNRINYSLGGVTHYVPATALADGDISPSHLHFSIDETNDLLRVKWKESGGTVLSSIVLTSALGTTGTGSLVFSDTPSITTPHISGTLFASGSSGIQFGDGGGTAGATTGFISPVSDGVFRIGDSAGGGSPHLIFGSNSSSFVRIKRSGTALAVRLGDDSGDGDITARGGAFTGTVVQTSNSATAFESGPNGGTNPVFRLVNSTASSATGISVAGAAAGGGVTITTLSSGTNESLTIAAKGSGNISLTANRVASSSFQATSASGGFIVANSAPIRLGVSSLLTWGSNSDSTVSVDLFLRRAGGANLAFGNVNAASPVNQILSTQGSREGTDSNVSGANLAIISGLGTGNSTPSSLFLQSPLIGSTGTTAQVATTGLTIINGTAKLTSYTVATLPSASVAGDGAMAFVTDANTTIILGIGTAVVGGGSNKVKVYSDGASWLIG